MPRLSKRQSKALASSASESPKPKDAVLTPSPRNCRLREIQRRRSTSREGRSPSRGGAVLTKICRWRWWKIIETLGWGRDAINALVGDRKAIAVADMGNPQRAQTDRGDRARGDVLVMEDGEVAPFDELADAPGMSWRRRARAFKKSGLIECWSARFALFRMGLDLFRLCMKRGAAYLARRRFQPI